MSLLQKVFINTAVTLTTNVASAILSVLTTVLLLRYLSIPQYGLYTLTLSVALVTSSFIDFGIRNIVIADVAKELGQKKIKKAEEIIGSYQLWVFCFSVGVSVLVFILLNTFSFLHPLRFSFILTLSSLVFMIGFSNILSTTLYAFSRFIGFSFFIILFAMIEFIFLFVALKTSASAQSALTAYLLSIFLTSLFFIPIVFLNRKNPLISRSFIPIQKIYMAHGKYGVGASAVKSVSDYLPLWILHLMTGLQQTGIYAAGFKLFQTMLFIPTSIEQVLLPTLSGIANKKHFKNTYLLSIKYSLWINTLMAGFAMLTVYPLTQWLFPKFVISIPILFIFMPAALIYAFATGQRSVYFAHKAQMQFLKSWLLTFFLTLLIGTFAAWQWQAKGMATAFLISLTITTFYRQWQVNRIGKVKINLKDLFTLNAQDIYLFRSLVGMIKTKS